MVRDAADRVRRPAVPLFGFLLVGLVLVACGAPARTPYGPSVATATATPGGAAAADLDLLLDRIESIHPDPWHGVARADFVAALDRLKGDIGSMTSSQAEVAVMRLVAMISAKGGDGHMFALPATGHEGPVLPVRLYEFADGVHLTAAMSGYEELVGARLLGVNGHPIEAVLAALEPLVPRDGPATVPAFRPVFLLRTEVLAGLGLIGDETGAAVRHQPRHSTGTNGDGHARALRGVRGLGGSQRGRLPAGSI